MEELIYIALIAILAGLIKGVSGFGSSLVAMPLLTMVYGVDRIPEIVVMMITFNVVLNLLLLFENKGFSLKSLNNIKLITTTGVVFTFVGLSLLDILDVGIINTLAASMILLAVVVKAYTIFVENPITMKPYKLIQIFVGALSGFGNGVASIDGPPAVFYLTGIKAEKALFKNTLAAHFLVMGVMGVVIIIFKGQYTRTILLNTSYFVAFSSIGVLSGMMISKRLNEKIFEKIVLVILVLLAIRMILF